MEKESYFLEIERGLYGLPHEDVLRWLEFYRENLADRIEEGFSEADALARMGTPAQVVAQILAQTPLTRVLYGKVRQKKGVPVWVIVALALGSPVWLALLVSALAVFISVYAVLWSLVITFYAVDASLLGTALGGVAACAVLLGGGHAAPALLLLAGGLVCLGLGILCFLPQKRITVAACRLCIHFLNFVKSIFVGKEGA